MGGTVNEGVSSLYGVTDWLMVTYADVTSKAQTQLDWLIRQLTEPQ